MQSPRDGCHLPARIGGEDHEANDADRRNDERTRDAPTPRNAPVARQQDERCDKDGPHTKVEEPRRFANCVLRGGIDPRIKGLVNEIAGENGCRSKHY